MFLFSISKLLWWKVKNYFFFASQKISETEIRRFTIFMLIALKDMFSFTRGTQVSPEAIPAIFFSYIVLGASLILF